jgi:hypothetical protein
MSRRHACFTSLFIFIKKQVLMLADIPLSGRFESKKKAIAPPEAGRHLCLFPFPAHNIIEERVDALHWLA